VLPLYFVREDLARARLRRLFPSMRMSADRFRLSWRTDHPHAAELSALAAELSARPLQ
jgi:DNA-binding transcriptional LysR family regulator